MKEAKLMVYKGKDVRDFHESFFCDGIPCVRTFGTEADANFVADRDDGIVIPRPDIHRYMVRLSNGKHLRVDGTYR